MFSSFILIMNCSIERQVKQFVFRCVFLGIIVITDKLVFLVGSIYFIFYYTSNPQLSSSASFLRLNVLSSLN